MYVLKTRKTYTVSQKLKGKIKSGTQEIVPTRPKKHKGEGGIADDVRASFSEGDAAKMLSIARYWIGSGGNTLPRLESCR